MSLKSEKLLRTELLISYVLRYGVLLCLFVIGCGLAARLLHPQENAAVIGALVNGRLTDYRPPVGVAEVLAGLRAGDADAVIALGLMLLIALPIARVALTMLVFLRDRDWAFFAITLIVLTVLLSGILLGRAL